VPIDARVKERLCEQVLPGLVDAALELGDHWVSAGPAADGALGFVMSEVMGPTEQGVLRLR
jgi:hypothetical protein